MVHSDSVRTTMACACVLMIITFFDLADILGPTLAFVRSVRKQAPPGTAAILGQGITTLTLLHDITFFAAHREVQHKSCIEG